MTPTSRAHITLEDASRVKRLRDDLYEVNLAAEYCIGTMPNGGYVASLFLRAAELHCGPRKQPHPITSHWSFLNRTNTGRALIRVEESKIGRLFSVLHLTLHQHGILPSEPFISSDSQADVVAYLTNTHLAAESGIKLPTGWTLEYEPPRVDLEKVASNGDSHWTKLIHPLLKRGRCMDLYMQRSGHIRPAIQDYWAKLPDGELIKQSSLGYVADTGPAFLIEEYRPTSPDVPIREGGFAFNKSFWYPTLTMSLDVSRQLPPEGLPWIRLRVSTKEVKNGRYDATVHMFDVDGNLLATANHVDLAIDIERNYAKRGSRGKI